MEEIKAELQRVLDTLTEKNFRKRSRNGGDGGTGVCMREGTTSRMMAADEFYGEFYDWYSVRPEYFVYTLVRSYTCLRFISNIKISAGGTQIFSGLLNSS
jgi:hypothetical protein